PNFHGLEMLPLLGAILLVLAILAFRPRPRATMLAVIAANIAMTLIAQRNVAMFALTAVPLLALVVNPWWADTVGRWPPLQRFGRLARSGHTTPLVLAGVAWLAVITLSRGQIAGRTIVPEGFSSTRFPVAAVTEARQAGLEGRLFHEFIWGGYVLHAWPEQRVFIDGGTDFYGSALLKTHQAVIGLQPGWRDSLETYRIELVLVRSRSSLAAELARDATWRVWHCDSTAALFTRHQHDPPPAAIPSPECLSR
ncbi:MAG TPA: hypothetical protein VLL51_07090, partial [Gemmatimonadales bacterium]|nr:hypothetical protein [Gemmatimonadales bacterium]